jgi:parvulin-like peptidyl-prolyl isomerase
MRHRTFALLALILLLSAACRQNPAASGATATVAPVVQATLPPPVTASSTPIPPTPTPTEPLAAQVNGQPITLAAFEREMARYAAGQTAAGVPAADAGAQVLDALIDRELILQAAAVEGMAITDEDLSARLAELQAVYATPAEFDAWLQSVGYTIEEFRAALAAELVTGRMVAQVTAGVPDTAEHVRARYIQMDDAAPAQAVLDRARAGDDFAFLAQQNSVDRVTGEIGGDLGFFAAGALLVPEVEAAAFALQPEEISDLIAVTNADGTTTYYIIQVMEREADRALGVDAYQARLEAAFDEWLAQLRAAATIERFVP